MGTFLISPLRGQKGTDLLQVCPLLLGNEECPHFFPGGRSSEAYGPARLQKWLRRDASRRPVLASSSPRSIRSQSGSTLGRRAHRHRTVPACQPAQQVPIPLLGEESRASRAQPEPEHRVLRSFPLQGTCRDGSTKGNEAADRGGGGVRGGLRADGDAPLRVVRLPTADSLCDRMERGEEEAHTGRRDASQRSHFCRRAGP